MKKILSLIIILALVFPACAFADTEAELVGTWAGSSEFVYGEVNYFLIRFYDDHTAIYETNKIEITESEGFNLVYSATWELLEDGVHVYYKNFWDSSKKEEIVLYLTQAHYLAYPLASTYVMFIKLPERRLPGTFHTISTWD